MRKEYSPEGEYAKKITAELRSRKMVANLKQVGALLGLTATVATIFALAKLYSRFEDAADYKERIVVLEEKSKVSDEQAKTFHVLQSGFQDIVVSPSTEAQFVIPFKQVLANQPFVGVTIPKLSSAAFSTTVQYQSPDSKGEQFNAALIKVRRLDSGPSMEMRISWLVATPKDGRPN